jgi:hypothetical protein
VSGLWDWDKGFLLEVIVRGLVEEVDQMTPLIVLK